MVGSQGTEVGGRWAVVQLGMENIALRHQVAVLQRLDRGAEAPPKIVPSWQDTTGSALTAFPVRQDSLPLHAGRSEIVNPQRPSSLSLEAGWVACGPACAFVCVQECCVSLWNRPV